MFYSQFILAKKGPLGTIWIAAHLERKLRKNQVADTDIGVSVDTIISSDVPIALRLSSHLLLGVVRIYSRKVNYLFDDCSEALLKVKQAFRSAAVDLPPEESKAPYHSITMPETFDLDDFELPDNDILQGNFVDHHVSSREQITLQDTMEGVSYSTSKFGLDERFGDGDASGLDLDEELFLENILSARQVDESADPQASVVSIDPIKLDELSETTAVNSGTMVVGVDYHDELVDYAQAPCTPGLVEEPNLSKVSASDDHLESEYHLVESSMTENADEDKHEVDWYSRDNLNYDATPVLLSEGTANKLQGDSLLGAKTEHAPVEDISLEPNPDSGLLDQVELLIHASDVTSEEDLQKHAVNNDDSSLLDKRFDDVVFGKNASEISDVAISCQQVSIGASDNNPWSHVIEVSISDQLSVDQQKFGADISHVYLKKQEEPAHHSIETKCHEPMISAPLNVNVNEKVDPAGSPFLRPCNSTIEQPDTTTPGYGMSHDIYVQFDAAVLESRGKEDTATLGEVTSVTKNSRELLKENHGQEGELLKPEKMMSATESHLDENRTLVVHNSPGELVRLDEGDDGSKIVSGKKRSFTESTITEQSLNSAESSRLVRFKQTVESVPDDDDLLSSILVGRSSVLKVKPTPRRSEVTSIKLTRSAPRTVANKRKVLMDDTMVLHGDAIRQQLMDTQDIRRVRKKAPCTRPEISMIEKQFLEDEIFLVPVFSGMSTELLSLHSQMRDLSGVTVCKNNQNGDSAEIVTNPRLSSDNDEKVLSVGIVTEPILACKDVKHADTFSPVAGPHLTSQNAENGETRDTENINKQLSTAEHSGQWITNELSLETDQGLAEAFGSHFPSNSRIHEIEPITDSFVCKETTNPTNNLEAVLLQHELPLEATEVEANDFEVNSSFISEVSDVKTSMHADPVIPADGTKDASFEFDSSLMDVDNVQVMNTDELGKVGDANAIYETEPVIVDDLQSDVALAAAAAELLSNSKDGELKYNEHSEIHTVLSGQDAPCSYPVLAGLQHDGFEENAGNTEQSGSYQYSMVGAEGSGLHLHDQEEFKYSPAGIDTEFLNFDDDDELTDIADDPLPDDPDARFAENTGWSSRTRAVSKYLQTLFVKEAECGRKSLSTDGLLCGKSRKEASRLFFETLVLKTRDYIHVEQQTPFGDIAIQPRTWLMKSDF